MSESYTASQALGEAIRAAGGAGIIYDSLRHVSGVDVVARRPRNVLDVVRTDHFKIAYKPIEADRREGLLSAAQVNKSDFPPIR